jgi:hypothetical protein
MTENQPTHPAQTRRPRHHLRALLTVAAAAPLIAISACSGEAPITATTAPAAPTTAAPSPTTSGTGETGTTTTTSAPAPSPTTLTPKGKITDDVLGHVITPVKVETNLPWPEESPVGEEHFELVGVELKVSAGKRYSATVDPSMFTIKPASGDPIPATNEFKGALGKELGTVKRGQTKTGWLIFKVDKGAASALELQFNRPTYEVSTTDKTIKPKTFSLKLTP